MSSESKDIGQNVAHSRNYKPFSTCAAECRRACVGDKGVEAWCEDMQWEREGKRWRCGGGEGRWQEEDWDRGAGETGARGGDGGRGWKGTGWGEKMCTSV